MILSVNNNSYQVSLKIVDNCIKFAKEQSKPNTIVAVERQGVVQMLKETFDNNDKLWEAVKKYKKQGFQAHFRGNK